MTTVSYFEHNARRHGEIGHELVDADEIITQPALLVEERELLGDEAQVVGAWVEFKARAA